MSGSSLVEERLRRDPIGPPFERDAPVLDVFQHHGRDVDVVRNDLRLGEPNQGIQHLVQVRDLERAASNLGTNGNGCRH